MSSILLLINNIVFTTILYIVLLYCTVAVFGVISYNILSYNFTCFVRFHCFCSVCNCFLLSGLFCTHTTSHNLSSQHVLYSLKPKYVYVYISSKPYNHLSSPQIPKIPTVYCTVTSLQFYKRCWMIQCHSYFLL